MTTPDEITNTLVSILYKIAGLVLGMGVINILAMLIIKNRFLRALINIAAVLAFFYIALIYILPHPSQ